MLSLLFSSLHLFLIFKLSPSDVVLSSATASNLEESKISLSSSESDNNLRLERFPVSGKDLAGVSLSSSKVYWIIKLKKKL